MLDQVGNVTQIVTGGSVPTDYSSLVQSDGPVSYWRFEETGGATAADAMGRNPGTYTGGYTLGQDGALAEIGDKAVQFDGTTGHVLVPDSASLDIGDGPLSVELWFRRTGTFGVNYAYLVGKGSQFALEFHSDNTLVWNQNGQISAQTIETFPNDDGWHHVVAVHDSSAGPENLIFIDGVENGQNRGTNGFVANTLNLNIGRNYDGANYYAGHVDELAVYDRALTAQEVAEHYAMATTVGGEQAASGDLDYSSLVQAGNPVSYWRFEETTGTNAADTTGTNDGTYTGGYTLGQDGALAESGDKAVQFNGTTGHVLVPDSASLDIGDGPLSVELWFRRTGTFSVNYAYLLGKGSQFALEFHSDNTLVWDQDGEVSARTIKAFSNDDGWHHVVAVHDSSASPENRIYIDGVENGQQNPGVNGFNANNLNLNIGRNYDGFYYFAGLVDELAVYDRALTAQEVAEHHAAGVGDSGGGSVESTYAYDGLYRLVGATDPIVGTTSYSYDPVGNRLNQVRGSTNTYTYDRADRITSLQGPPAAGSSTRPPSTNDAGWTSSANGYTSDNVYATTAPAKNKTKTLDLGTFGFDSAVPANATISGVTVSVEWKVSTTASIATLGARAYVNGSPVGSEFVNSAEPTSDTTQTFSVSGLTRAQLLDGVFEVRVRASRGNTNTAFTASLDAVSVTVDYSAPGSLTLTTNANGNLVAKGADTFIYDQANRLISATVAGVTETYTYDGDGVRFSRQVGAGPATRYVSDNNTSLPVTLDDGTRKYVWGLGLAYAVSGSSIEVYHTDRLGSVRTITDAAGSVTATYRTDEYGIATASSGSSGQPFGFTGEPHDATGLTYLRDRYYDPMLGRFLSRDTSPGFKAVPVTLNRAIYGHNNPTTLADPSGQKALALDSGPGGPIPSESIIDTIIRIITTDRCAPTTPDGEPRCVGGYVEFGPGRGRLSPNEVGKAGEAAVRAVADIGPKIRINVGNRVRIPDGLTDTVLSEVKNVTYQSYTQQLQDYVAYATTNNLRFDLWVRRTTQLSAELEAKVAAGVINVWFIP